MAKLIQILMYWHNRCVEGRNCSACIEQRTCEAIKHFLVLIQSLDNQRNKRGQSLNQTKEKRFESEDKNLAWFSIVAVLYKNLQGGKNENYKRTGPG